MTKLILQVMLQLAALTHAMNIDLGQFKLDEKEIQTKSRYVYSDFKENKSEPLENASAKFDIGVYQQNYDNMTNSTGQFDDAYFRLYIIMTTSEQLTRMTNVVHDNEDYLEQQNLTYAYLFKPMKKDFAYYKEIDMTSDNNANNRMNGDEVGGNDYGKSTFNETDQMTFNHTEPIKQEGVYYVSFAYEIIDGFKLQREKQLESRNNDESDLDQNLKYSSGVNTNSTRRELRSHFYYKKFGTPPMNRKFLHDPYQNKFMDQPRLIVTGSITFQNTHGYLSAQLYQNIELNSWFLAIFSILSVLWSLGLYKYQKNVLPVHYMISAVIYACFFESMFTLLFYTYENKSLGDYTMFWVFITFMEMTRAVLSRVVVLLVALGQHITTFSLGDRYHMNIAIVLFFYSISLAAAIIMQHMKDEYKMGVTTVFIAELPNYIFNVLICLWILMAFRRTLFTLNQNGEYNKTNVVMQMFLVYTISLFAIAAVFIYDQVGRSHPDQHWKSLAAHLNSYFMVFIFVCVMYAFILRPSNPKLAETFNQYQDLSNDDNPVDRQPQFMPEGPDNENQMSTEMAEMEPMDKKEAARQEALQRENDAWKRSRPKKWEY